MRRLPTLPAVLLLALLAGCGSSSSSNKTSSTSTGTPTAGGASTSTTPAAAPKPSGAAGKTVVVKMKNIAFAPQTVTVKVGQPVKWVNQDAVVHNVTAQNGASFHSSDFNQGGTYTYTPAQAGTISYVCTIHPNMTATLKVTS